MTGAEMVVFPLGCIAGSVLILVANWQQFSSNQPVGPAIAVYVAGFNIAFYFLFRTRYIFVFFAYPFFLATAATVAIIFGRSLGSDDFDGEGPSPQAFQIGFEVFAGVRHASPSLVLLTVSWCCD